jgi:hypothetical protein
MNKAIRILGLAGAALFIGLAALVVYLAAPSMMTAQYTPPAPRIVTAVNSSITASSLGNQAICALHTDTGCGNTTDATAANCPAGTLTAACTFPTSLTLPAGSLRGLSILDVSIGTLSTATLPNIQIEIYLDSVRIFAGAAAAGQPGNRVTSFPCNIAIFASGATAPLAISCPAAGFVNPSPTTSLSSNLLLTNTTPAISIDTTVSHALKLSVSYSANTTGNMAWLNGMRFSN